uniref:Serpentine receptor class gamma n=1 Tax=Steinernema glaseri TaxID=37863 RepID=A0A1I7ZYQ7_9BILA
MDYFRCFVAAVYIGIPLTFGPFYVAIVYVLFIRTNYRKLRCYRLMIQLGVSQILMSVGFITAGIASVLQYDPAGAATTGAKLMTACLRVEAGISLALALDRCKVVCSLKIPNFIIQFVVLVSWLFGLVHFSVLISPLADFPFRPEIFAPVYDYSKPLSAIVQKIGYFYSLSTMFITFCLYLLVVSYLLHKQVKLNFTKSDFNQKWIFMQALLRFTTDATVTIFYHFGTLLLTKSVGVAIAVVTGYAVNNLVIPTVLYIGFNRRLRRDIFGRELLIRVAVPTSMLYTVSPANT